MSMRAAERNFSCSTASESTLPTFDDASASSELRKCARAAAKPEHVTNGGVQEAGCWKYIDGLLFSPWSVTVDQQIVYKEVRVLPIMSFVHHETVVQKGKKEKNFVSKEHYD